MARVKFMNTGLDNLTMGEALAEIDRLIQRKIPAYVVTPNVDHIVRLEQGGTFAEAYRHADLILTDGMPLLWIARWYGTPIKEKISGSDLFPRLCEMAAKKGYTMFFLGAAEGIAAKAADNMKKKYPGLSVVGTYSPPFGFEKFPEELQKIEQIVTAAHPQILIVALGCPKQECFLFENREKLNVPVSLGLGATLDFAAGSVKRAPKWMSEHGLEWLFRIMQEPKRMGKRYLVDDRKILGLAIKYKKSAVRN